MEIYISIYVFLLGLVLASFVNALLYRIDKEYKYPDIFVKGSHCEKCKKQLKWFELIPVLSYILFKGKCRECGYPIPIYYPISELLLGLAFAGIYIMQWDWYVYILVILLFVMSYFDRIYHGVPKIVVHTFLGFAIVTAILNYLFASVFSLAIAVAVLLITVILVISKIMKKPFGLGDILVLLGLGLLLSPSEYLMFIYIFLGISFVFIISLLIMKRITIKEKIPLLPLFFVSFVILIYLGDYLSAILSKYFYL